MGFYGKKLFLKYRKMNLFLLFAAIYLEGKTLRSKYSDHMKLKLRFFLYTNATMSENKHCTAALKCQTHGEKWWW